MNLMVSKEDIESIFGPEYDRIRDVAQSLSSLEDDGDREIFLLAHTFSNVAAPIMGNIQLRRSFATVIEICDHAIDRIKHPEETLDGHPVQTVHSVHFMELQDEYLSILDSIKKKATDNRKFLGLTI